MQTVNAQKTQDLIRSGHADVINVLSPKSYRKHHIPGSINIPLDADDFQARVIEKVSDKDRTVVVYCANEDCSASEQAARILQEELDYTDVRDFEEGLDGWRQAGFTFEGEEREGPPAPSEKGDEGSEGQKDAGGKEERAKEGKKGDEGSEGQKEAEGDEERAQKTEGKEEESDEPGRDEAGTEETDTENDEEQKERTLEH